MSKKEHEKDFVIGILRREASEVEMVLVERDGDSGEARLTASLNMLHLDDDGGVGLKPICILEIEYGMTAFQKSNFQEVGNSWVRRFIDAGFDVVTSLKIQALESMGPWADHSRSVGVVIFEGEDFSLENHHRIEVGDSSYDAEAILAFIMSGPAGSVIPAKRF